MRVQWIGVLALPLTIAAACSSETTGLSSTPDSVLLVNDLNDPAWPRDPINLDSATVTPTGRVRLFTTFGGGCRDHVAALILDRAFMESYPPILRGRVAHQANDDPCDALLSRTFEFDLAPVRDHYQQSYQATSGAVHIDVAGVRVTYTFE